MHQHHKYNTASHPPLPAVRQSHAPDLQARAPVTDPRPGPPVLLKIPVGSMIDLCPLQSQKASTKGVMKAIEINNLVTIGEPIRTIGELEMTT